MMEAKRARWFFSNKYFSAGSVGIALSMISVLVFAAPIVSKKETPQKSVPKPFLCTGFYKSITCSTKLFLNKCQQSIEMNWPPLLFPGTNQWAQKHRNFCTVSMNGVQRKLHPQQCDKLLEIVSSGIQGFREVKWQDSKCELNNPTEGILYVTQEWKSPESQSHFTQAPKIQIPDPSSVLLEDVGQCVLQKAKKWKLVCPVLPQREQTWLRKFLAILDTELVIQNSYK